MVAHTPIGAVLGIEPRRAPPAAGEAQRDALGILVWARPRRGEVVGGGRVRGARRRRRSPRRARHNGYSGLAFL